MRIAAELRAVDLISTLFGRDEPDWNPHARDCILSNAHRNDLEGMDDVARTDIGDHGLVDRDVHLTEAQDLDVVLALRILRNDGEKVRRANQVHVLPAEFAVLAGVTNIPT